MSAHPLTRDGFDDEHWLELCGARRDYLTGRDRGTWYRLLRAWCGYRTGSSIKTDMEAATDAWLATHPTWVRHREERDGDERSCGSA